jgi:AAA15 family ATPase/GTPase
MILRFGVSGYASFRDEVELSFVSTSQKDEPSHRLATEVVPHGVLPVLGVYGGNASGKSNLLEAIEAFRDHVKHSFTRTQPTAPVTTQPWRHAPSTSVPATRMELDLLIDGVRHHYGFRIHDGAFMEEWLLRWPSTRRQVVFHRESATWQPDVTGSDWYFGPSLSGQRTSIAKATRANSLFLSTAAQHNHEELGAVAAAIVRSIVGESNIQLQGWPLFRADDAILRAENRSRLLALLAASDVGVHDVVVEEVENPLKQAITPLEQVFRPDALQKLVEDPDASRNFVELHLVRHSAAGPWRLPPNRESRGTHVLLRRLSDLFKLLDSGGLLVIDELDTSLHPDLCAMIVALFTSPATNRGNAQLLFSTHDRGLLKSLRRDEVVLIDKDLEGASTLSVASDYRDLRGRDDLRAAHEQGRLGGVPVLGDLISAWAADVSH